jgi:hypothetical protein
MLPAQKSLKQKDSEKNCTPGEVFCLYVLLQDFLPKMVHFLLIIEKLPKRLKSRSYKAWAVEILPP